MSDKNYYVQQQPAYTDTQQAQIQNYERQNPVNSNSGFNFLNFLGNSFNWLSRNLNPLSFIGSAVGNLFNFGSQLENYNYQKRLQQQIFNREDTAFSRLAKDYQSLGYSPFLAIGKSYNSGSAVSTSAPQLENKALERIGILNTLKAQDLQNKSVQSDIFNKQVINAQERLKLNYLRDSFNPNLNMLDLNTQYRREMINNLVSQSELNKARKIILDKDAKDYDRKIAMDYYKTIMGSVSSLTGAYNNMSSARFTNYQSDYFSNNYL